MQVSVIIPVYGVENYLAQCVESVQNQTYINLQIILVDDGSPDNCGAICDGYAAMDNRIQVIHKSNGGLSDARNAGIAAARGEYVLFLDGDDFWDDDHAVEQLVNRLNKTDVDVLNFSYQKYYEDTGEKVPYFEGISPMPDYYITKEQQFTYLTKNNYYIASACNKIIRRTLLDRSMKFRTGIYSEDIEWCARLMVAAQSMDFVCANFYCYRQRRESITHTINHKKCEDLANNILACTAMAQNQAEPLHTALTCYTAYQYGTFFMVQAQAEDAPEDCIEKLKPYWRTLENAPDNKKLMILKWGCRLLGYTNLCRLIRFGYRTFHRC